MNKGRQRRKEKKILCAFMTTSHDDAISRHTFVYEYAVVSEYAMKFINIFL